MKKVVILSNHHAYTYNFRKEIINKLIEESYKVYIVLPYGEKVELLKELGCEFINLPLDRRGVNPITDLKLLYGYSKILKKIKPDIVLSYTVKPNIYGGLVCRFLKIPYFPNVTGLGSAVENKGILQRLLITMYRQAYKKASCVFFQNKENENFFKNNKIPLKRSRVIPGSGVNTKHFSLISYPSDETLNFIYISRIMKEKGIEQYLDAAKYIRKSYPNTRFHVLGFCEEDYENILKELEHEGVINYHGMQSDVRKFHEIAHCTIHPTYYPEGMSNVLLESAASGRPVITTNRSGCKEIVDENITGFIVEQQNSEDLISKIETFINLSYTEKKRMGLNGRSKVVKEFDRRIVVEAYMSEINRVAVNEK